MGGATTTDQTKTENSQTAPWAAAQPLLTDILGKLGGTSTAPSGDQNAALAALKTSANGIPNFGDTGARVVNNLAGSSTAPQIDTLNKSYNTLTGQLSPIASGANNDPMKNPAISGLLDTVRNDVTNSVDSRFAAAGRDLSPANSTALARGISQGEAGVLTDQYNKNVNNQIGAAGTLYGAGANTATTGAQLGQIPLNNQLQALQAAGQVPGLYTAPGQTQFDVANAGFKLPFQNIGLLESLGLPIAGLGSSSSGTSSGTTSQQQPLLPTLLGGGLMAASLFSDERVKDDIAEVGELKSGEPVYSYTYKGDPSGTTHIGLLAQEIERVTPEAVGEVGGVKTVHYGKATERARAIGLLDQLLAA